MRGRLVFYTPIWHNNLLILLQGPLFCVERVNPLSFALLHKVFTQKAFLSRIGPKRRSLRKEKISGIIFLQRLTFQVVNTSLVSEKLLDLIYKTLKGRAFEVREYLSLL